MRLAFGPPWAAAFQLHAPAKPGQQLADGQTDECSVNTSHFRTLTKQMAHACYHHQDYIDIESGS